VRLESEFLLIWQEDRAGVVIGVTRVAWGVILDYYPAPRR
jgi:hypothetical protein